MISGREMLAEMYDRRKDNDENIFGSLASEYYGKGFKIKASDLIMMNVPEKLDFLDKRQQYIRKRNAQSGITT